MSNSAVGFRAPVRQQTFQLEIKNSRFITVVLPTQSRTQALDSLASVREQYPDANHHCWAMIAGPPDDVFQQDQSDDGEPRGTAGKPMLSVLQHSGLGHLMVIVVRYFGGIKLGTGGLVRAYSQSVVQALSELDTQLCHVCDRLRLELPYAALDSLQHWMKGKHIQVIDSHFAEAVTLELDVPRQERVALEQRVAELGCCRWLERG